MSILGRVEHHPDGLFTEADLLSHARGEFEALRDLGILKAPPAAGSAAYWHGDGASYVVTRDGESILGLRLGEEPEVITLQETQIRQWTVDLPRLVAHVAAVNSLRGKPDRLTDRLWFLGEYADDEAVCMGLFGDLRMFEDQVASLPYRMPEHYNSFVVVCPTLKCPPTLIRRFETLSIRVRTFEASDPFVLPLEHIAAAPTFSHSPDYRSLTLKGKHYKLSPMRAKLVSILDRARRAGHADMPWEQIKSLLRAEPDPCYASRIQDVFKRFQGDWHEIVRTTSPGIHALNP
jgi:hypothetical protein